MQKYSISTVHSNNVTLCHHEQFVFADASLLLAAYFISIAIDILRADQISTWEDSCNYLLNLNQSLKNHLQDKSEKTPLIPESVLLIFVSCKPFP